MALIPSLNMDDICDKRLLDKLEILKTAYLEKFNDTPDFFVRAPGRVNLIGEHVDYNLYPVLPMAIEEDVVVAFGENKEGLINICNIDDKYPQIILTFDDIPTEADKTNIKWYDYIIAGVLGMSKKYELHPCFNILVYGTIPVAAGLSSSSALVCAAALAVAFNYSPKESFDVGKSELAQICATAEQYVGTKGGGMDQAIIFFAQKGFATKIEFHPSLITFNVPLPRDVTFIVAHSGVHVEKASSNTFNKRVAECKLAAKVLAKQSGLLDWTCVDTLKGLAIGLRMSHKQMLKFIDDTMEQQSYTGREICEELEITLTHLERILDGFQLHDLDSETFELQKRARHVYLECGNVSDFIISCETKDETALGQAMCRSHQSLRDNYECSHPKIDALVDYAMQHGALGARLTGAGWGGCIVAAVNKDKETYIEYALKDYMERNNQPTKSVFLTRPYSGAFVIDLDNQSSACIDITEEK